MALSERLSDTMLAACERWRGRPAVVAAESAWTYEKLGDCIRHLANVIGAKVGEPNCVFVPEPAPLSIAIFFAMLRAGKVPFVADPKWDAAALSSVCDTLGCNVLVTGTQCPVPEARLDRTLLDVDRQRAMVWTLANIAAGPQLRRSTAFVRFSSGSTGRPRALEFSSTAAVRAAETWKSAASMDLQDRVLCLASLNNGLAFNTSLMPVFLSGATLHLHAGLLAPAAMLATALKVRPTIVVGFPFILELLLTRGGRLRESLQDTRLVVSSAAPLKPETAARWQETVGIGIGHYYGLAETGPVTFNSGRHSDSSGVPLPGVEVRAAGREESPAPIRVRTPYQATAYISDGQPPLADSLDSEGFFVASDLGYLDEAGCLHVTGRSGRVANIAGNKFSLDAVEAAICSLSGVEGAHVHLAETRMTAYVHGPSVSVDGIKEHCLRVLPPVQVPHQVKRVPYLPRSASGKVSYASLELLSRPVD